MEIIDILDQMTTTYGHSTPTALLQNETLFRSTYSPTDAPEVLFRRIEDLPRNHDTQEGPLQPDAAPEQSHQGWLGLVFFCPQKSLLVPQ